MIRIIGNPHSTSNRVLNWTLIGILSSKNCTTCTGTYNCGWLADIPPKDIHFDEIYPSEQEWEAKNMFAGKEFKSAITETDAMLDLLTNIAEENNNIEFELVAIPVNGVSEDDVNGDIKIEHGFDILTFCTELN